jgi:hypothetical protein
MTATSSQDLINRANTAAIGCEARIIRNLIPSAERTVGLPSHWSLPHPDQPKSRLTFDTLSLTWEITGPAASLTMFKHLSGDGLVGFVRRARDLSSAEAAELILTELGIDLAAAETDERTAAHAIADHLYFIGPSRWLRLVLNEGVNAGRVAAHLLTTACLRKEFSLDSADTDPVVTVSHGSFASWGLNATAVSRAVKQLEKAKLISREAGKGRAASRYTLRISGHFAPRLEKRRASKD